MDNLRALTDLSNVGNLDDLNVVVQYKNRGKAYALPSKVIAGLFGKALIVSPSNSNGTGKPGSLGQSYKTIKSAEADASSGDVVFILEMMTNEISLGKDGVTYHFLPGSGITNDYAPGRPTIFTFRNGGTANDNRMFHDIGKTNNGTNPIKFYITGEGDFLSRGDHSDPGGLILITEGSTVEFNIKSSTLLAPTGNDKAESGAHFYVQSDLAPATYQGFLKGSVTRDVIGGHYFLGAHASSAVINVGGNVDISAIFCQAEGSQLIDLNVNGKITCGYCIPDGHKYFINVDRVPWFTDNTYAITGTNTFKVTAKKLEWINSGAAQVSYFNIMNVQEYHDAGGTHAFNYVDINIDEILIKAGDQATQRAVFRLLNNNSETYTRFKLDKCKITVEDGFPLFSIASSNEKAYVDMMFQDCSVDYKHDSLAASTVLMPVRYVMFHIINSRFKISDQGVTDGYILLDDSTSTDKNVQIDNVVTNAVIPTDLVNYGTAISSNSTGIRSGITDVRII